MSCKKCEKDMLGLNDIGLCMGCNIEHLEGYVAAVDEQNADLYASLVEEEAKVEELRQVIIGPGESCDYGDVSYGMGCKCGEIRPLTEEMQAFIDKYGTEKKWAMKCWADGEYAVFSGKFSNYAGAIAFDENGDWCCFHLSSVFIEYKEGE